jgi:aminopeptidase N
VKVKYAGHPASRQSQGEQNWLATADEVVAMNEPHMATWWFPADDHPRDKATYDIRITVPKDKKVVANGVLVSKRVRHGLVTAHWRAVEPMASYLAFFAAGSFAISHSRCNGIPDVVAVSKHANQRAPGKTARRLGHETCQIITALSTVLGPYPFSATGGLVTGLPVSFSLENQTRPTYPAASGVPAGLMTHELAHQWFGDLVSVSNWRDIWLNEGFASFMADYTTELRGGLTMQQRVLETYDSLPSDSALWKLSIDDPGPVRLFDGAVYSRGEMAVQALRHRIGDPAFSTLLHGWLSQHAYANGSVADFEALATSVSGQDLTGFFDAWLHEPVMPARTAANGLG